MIGVANWLDYDELMSFIVTYFMLHQQIQKMFDEPHHKQPGCAGRSRGQLSRLVSWYSKW